MLYGQIRTIFARSRLAGQVREKARARDSGPKGGKRYTCAYCKQVFSISAINVDHCNPVIPVGKHYSELSWDELVNRIWCHPDNLQVLCKKCHKEKTKVEQQQRKELRHANKKV